MKKNKLKRFLLSMCVNCGEKWNIGIIKYDESIITDGKLPQTCWLKHNFKGWFADPFILEEDENTYTILVEAMPNYTRKGQLARLIVSKPDFSLLKMDTILELDTHLSFPAILRGENGEVKIYPENFQSGSSYIYKYSPTGELYEPVQQCKDALTDAIIFDLDGVRYMTTTMAGNESGSVLSFLKWNEETSLFEPFQDIELGDNIARGAGAFFNIDGKIIRPAQIYDGGYGKGLVFQELSFDGTAFSVKELQRILPSDKKYNAGLHTFNKFGDVAMIDGYYYLPKLLRFPFRVMHRILVDIGWSDGLFSKDYK